MSVMLSKLYWYPVDTPTVGTLINDAVLSTPRKALDIKNNIYEFTVKNASGEYLTTSYVTKFKEKDKFKLYAKLTDDGADIESDAWLTSTNLIGTYILEEFEMQTNSDVQRIKLSAVDQTYLLFNRVLAKEYGVAQIYTAPGIFRSVIRLNTNKDGGEYQGTQNDAGSYFNIDSKFVSEGGYITDYRSTISTTLSSSLSAAGATITVSSTTGFADQGTLVIGDEHIYYTSKNATQFLTCSRGIDDTVDSSHSSGVTVYQGFPVIQLSLIWKPVFEWTTNLGQIQNTNYSSEQEEGASLYYDRAFLLWVDELNKIHWLPADDTVDGTLTIGTDKIYEHAIEKSVFDSVNFVIYNCGDDMYGNGITWYWYDSRSNVPDLKMRYQPMTSVSKNYIDKDRKVNVNRETTPANDLYKQFPTDASYPISDWAFKDDANRWASYNGETAWATLTDDGDYNDSLRDACKWKGLIEAQAITSKLAGLRYKGSIVLRFAIYNPGDLIQVTNVYSGLSAQNLRVTDVHYNLAGASVTLEVEEDEKRR